MTPPCVTSAIGQGQIGAILLVTVRDNNIDQALKFLKKKMQREENFREMKLRTAYEKPEGLAPRAWIKTDLAVGQQRGRAHQTRDAPTPSARRWATVFFFSRILISNEPINCAKRTA